MRLHVQKMIGLLEQLVKLGYNVDHDLATDFILYSLPPSFSMFKMNYNMAGELKPLSELHSMLATAESSMGKRPEALTVSKVSRKVGKKGNKRKTKTGGKGKGRAGSKTGSKPVKSYTPTADTVCFHCSGKYYCEGDKGPFDDGI